MVAAFSTSMEELHDVPCISSVHVHARHCSVAGRLRCSPLAGCGGEAAKYSGNWKRDLYGEGEVKMNLASNGDVELMLPSPRWPDSVDMKGEANSRATR